MHAYKKYFLYCSLMGNAMLLALLNRQFPDELHKTEAKEKEPLTNSTSQPIRKASIALLYAGSTSIIDMILQGFKEELAQDPQLQPLYREYNYSSDRTLLRSHIEDIINRQFDLIFTIGHAASIMASEITRKRQCQTPLVFAAVQDPVEVGIVPKDRDHTCFITGSSVDSTERYEQEFSLLLLLQPHLKRLLIPYNPVCDNIIQRKITNVETYMNQRGIPVQKIEIFSIAECLAKIAAFIQTGDVIWIPRDPMVMSSMPGIAKLAYRYKSMIYTANSDSIAKGAALIFGADDKGSGYNAGKKARKILVEGKHPSDVSITPAPYVPYLGISKQALTSQVIEIDPLLLFLMEHGRIIEVNS